MLFAIENKPIRFQYTTIQTLPPQHFSGDADGDGNVDMADVIRMMRAAAGWKVGIDEGQADLDKDGKVSVKDVILLMRALS